MRISRSNGERDISDIFENLWEQPVKHALEGKIKQNGTNSSFVPCLKLYRFWFCFTVCFCVCVFHGRARSCHFLLYYFHSRSVAFIYYHITSFIHSRSGSIIFYCSPAVNCLLQNVFFHKCTILAAKSITEKSSKIK